MAQKKKANKKTSKGAERLTHLRNKETDYPATPRLSILETFDNSHPEREYLITLECPEFTAICPITGQPDFGDITISYFPDKLCLESKSLKLYLFSYRNHGAFHEEVVNMILDDCLAVCRPLRMTVSGEFNPRGGISIQIDATYDGQQSSRARTKSSKA